MATTPTPNRQSSSTTPTAPTTSKASTHLARPGLRFAVHAYAWTSHWSNAELGCLDRAKNLGFDVLEVPLMEPDDVDPSAVRRRAEQVGLGLCCSTACNEQTDITSDDPVVRAAGVAYLRRCVDLTAQMGAQVFSGVVYSAIGAKIAGFPTAEHRQRSADALRDVAEYAGTLGVVIGLEPVNRYETYLVNTADQALALAAMVELDNVRVHLDTYHMNIEEADFYEPTRRCVDRLCHYHLSESHRGAPGSGTVDWPAVFCALADGGYCGMVGLESFVEVAPAMQAATCVWRAMAASSDQLLSDGLAYLKALEVLAYARPARSAAPARVC